MVLRLTQPLTDMNTRNIYWVGKSGRCVGLTTLPPSSANFLEIWEPQPLGNPEPVQACNGTALPLDPRTQKVTSQNSLFVCC